MDRFLSATSIVLLSAHVTLVCLDDSRTHFLLAALGVVTVNFFALLPRGPVYDYFRTGLAHHVVYLLVSWFIDAFVVYCIAFACAPFILWWIDVAHARGLVKYDPQTSYFLISRATVYALVRSTTHALVREVDAIPAQFELLAPVTIASIETLLMIVQQTTAYAFTVSSGPFLVYTLLKTTVLLVVPRFEVWIFEML